MESRKDQGGSMTKKADLCNFLLDMGVNVKTPLSTSSAPASFPPAQQQSRELTKDPDSQTPPRVAHLKGRCRCGWERNGQSHTIVYRPYSDTLEGGWSCLVTGVKACFLVLVLCSVSYLLHQNISSKAEIRELNRRLDKLDSVFGESSKEPETHKSVVTGNDGPASHSETIDNSLDTFKWQTNAHHPGSASVQEESYLPENVGTGYITPEEDDEEDEGDDDDEEDQGGNDQGLLYQDLLRVMSRQKRSTKPEQPRVRRRGGKGKRKSRAGKKTKVRKMTKKCERMLKCLPTEPKLKSLLPVHFTSEYFDKRQTRFGQGSDSEGLLMAGEDWCMFITEWNATVCSNKTARYHVNEAPLRLTKEAGWMKHMYPAKAQQPIVSLGDGGFNVTQSGMYFLYASVMIRDLKPRQSIVIKKNGVEVFKCMDSVDSIKGGPKYKTCHLSGVTYLHAGTRLEVQNVYGQTEIDQIHEATYFGAILLLPVELDYHY